MKVKAFFNVVLTLSVFLIFGCALTGTVFVSVKPNTSFTPKSTITVVCQHYSWGRYHDPLKVQGRLERLLMSRGYEVVSSAVASDKIKYEDKIRRNDNGREAEASLERVREFRSIYVLRFDYDSYALKECFEHFTASVVDLRTGEVVASADYSPHTGDPMFGCKSTSSVLEEFVNKLKAK